MRSHYVDDAPNGARRCYRPFPAQGKGLRRGGFPSVPSGGKAWQEAHDRTRDHARWGGSPLASPDSPMTEILCIMTGKGFGCVGIMEKGILVGIITDGDLRRHMDGGLLGLTAERVMSGIRSRSMSIALPPRRWGSCSPAKLPACMLRGAENPSAF